MRAFVALLLPIILIGISLWSYFGRDHKSHVSVRYRDNIECIGVSFSNSFSYNCNLPEEKSFSFEGVVPSNDIILHVKNGDEENNVRLSYSTAKNPRYCEAVVIDIDDVNFSCRSATFWERLLT